MRGRGTRASTPKVGLTVPGQVDYRLLERFVDAQRRNTDGRYDLRALDRLRDVIELRRYERTRAVAVPDGSVVPLPLDD
jgi:hypothetical protein